MRVRKSIQEGDNEMKTSTAKPAAMATEGTVGWLALALSLDLCPANCYGRVDFTDKRLAKVG